MAVRASLPLTALMVRLYRAEPLGDRGSTGALPGAGSFLFPTTRPPSGPSAPTLPLLSGDLDGDVALVVDAQRDQVGPAADRAILGEGLTAARGRIHRQLVLLPRRTRTRTSRSAFYAANVS